MLIIAQLGAHICRDLSKQCPILDVGREHVDPQREPGLHSRQLDLAGLQTVDYVAEPLLRGDDQPEPSALLLERLGKSLQVEHSLHRTRDVLAGLVDHEHEPVYSSAATLHELQCPCRQPIGADVGRIETGSPPGQALGRAVHGIERLDRLTLGERGVPTVLPAQAGLLLKGALEVVQPAVALERVLEFGQREVARVAEPVKQRPVHRMGDRLALLGDHVGSSGEVQQHRERGRLAVDRVEQSPEARCMMPTEEPVGGRPVEHRRIREEVAEHLGPARLAGPEEAGHPHRAGLAGVVDRLLVGVEHRLQLFEDVVGGHVLVHLVGDGLLVGEVDLHDLFNHAVHVPAEQIGDPHVLDSLGTIKARYP